MAKRAGTILSVAPAIDWNDLKMGCSLSGRYNPFNRSLGKQRMHDFRRGFGSYHEDGADGKPTNRRRDSVPENRITPVTPASFLMQTTLFIRPRRPSVLSS